MNQLEQDIYSSAIEKLAFWPFSTFNEKKPATIKIPIYVDNRFVDETTGEPLPSFKSVKDLKGAGYPKIDDGVFEAAVSQFQEKNNIPYNYDYADPELFNKYESMIDDFIANNDMYDYLDDSDFTAPSGLVRFLQRYEEPYYDGQKPFREEDYNPYKHWWRDKKDPTKKIIFKRKVL